MAWRCCDYGRAVKSEGGAPCAKVQETVDAERAQQMQMQQQQEDDGMGGMGGVGMGMSGMGGMSMAGMGGMGLPKVESDGGWGQGGFGAHQHGLIM